MLPYVLGPLINLDQEEGTKRKLEKGGKESEEEKKLEERTKKENEKEKKYASHTFPVVWR